MNDLTLYNNLLIVGFIGLAVFLAIYFLFIRKYGVVVILDEYKGTLFQVAKKKVDLTKDFFTYKKKTYNIDWRNASYIDKNKPVIFFKLNDAVPIKISNPEKTMVNPEFLHLIVKEKVIEQLVKASYTPFSLNMITIILIILSLIAGVGIGYMSYPYLQPNATGG